MRERTLILHAPVLHRGYLELLRRLAPGVSAVYILGDELAARFRYFEHDISSLSGQDAAALVGALNLFPVVAVLRPESVTTLRGQPLVLMGDELSRRLAAELLPGADIRWESVFLRWDEAHVNRATTAKPDRVSPAPPDRVFLEAACQEAKKSGDWWRQVGAVLVKDGRVLTQAWNCDMPDDQSSYRYGNIRDYLKPGQQPELANAIHAESRIIAEAARRGLATEGAHLYVTHFPCPMCAKAVAASGMAKVFFGEGSANFDAEMVLRAAGVEMVYVPLERPT